MKIIAGVLKESKYTKIKLKVGIRFLNLFYTYLFYWISVVNLFKTGLNIFSSEHSFVK